MQKEFRALLKGSAAVSALASAIDWGLLPQSVALPAIALELIDNADGLTMQGPDGLWRGRVQVDCYAGTYGGAVALSEAVIDLLSGYRSGNWRLIMLVAQRSNTETRASDQPYRISVDFMTNWRKTNG
ncbi:hypothetical protein DL1_11940 [Thioclava dalianensis]|uniref:Gene transfer agent protein n=1 Tax=Thioclava dalianensis TaxID=1185766 RepID=A0A074T9D9_9RHOB|nr:DUF3168 domain-containing protein [Thioclava dalianensis]KEP68416.1 hypothetical protein DL1_11940 [Thioclava dalianensis]SFN62655.1 Protein of unknown function [Thioclava dalianensis]